MSITQFCDTVNVNEVPKYRSSTPTNDEYQVVNRNTELNRVVNSMWSCPTNQLTDKPINTYRENNNCTEVSKSILNKEIRECCPLTSSFMSSPSSSLPASAVPNDCSLPFEQWTGLAQQTGTRPAVDKYTISRYSPVEWKLYNEKLSNDANKAVQNAKNIMFNAKMMDGQVYLPVDMNQFENNIRIKDRAKNIFHWKVQLEINNRKVTGEIEIIQKSIQQLLRCNRSVELIINIDRDMLRVRNMRLPPDLIHDALTDEIIKEEALCAEIINLNTRCIDDVKKQMKELKSSKQRLEHDWAVKKSAYDIDTGCLNLNNSSVITQWKPGCAHLPDGQSNPISHEYFTKESIIFIQAALARSGILRENIKDMIRKSVKDLRIQANYVEVALIQQINTTVQACQKLKRALNKCLKSLADMEIIFGKINGAVRKLDAPMKCAQTRLNMRLERDNVENCRDIPQFTLIDEVKSISDGVTALLSQTKGAEQSIDELSKSRQKIEHEITVKEKTLWIDNERCRLLRSFYPTDEILYGYQ